MKKLLLVLLLLVTPAQAQIVNTLPFQLQNGTTADASQVMADFNQIVNNTNANAAKNGANSDITSLSALTTPITPAQGGTTVYTGTAGGSANAITVTTTSPTGFSLTRGKRVVTVAIADNTGATTLAAGGTTATNVYKLTPAGPAALTGGEIRTGSIIEAIYDGTQYQLVTNNLALLGPLTTLASATTTDLGTISSHNVGVTGVTTITSFGSTASTTFPIYYITFAGTLSLTYNATSMILPGVADITTAANDSAIAQYLGSGNWQIIFYQRASGTSVVAATPLCGATGLTIQNNSGTPNTNIDVAAGSAVMVNSTGASKTVTSPSVTVNTTINGANGLDTGARGNSTWYYMYLISDGSTTAGLASASATAPTLPGIYTYSCRLGAMLTDGSANFYRSLQKGRRTQYKVTSATNTANLFILDSGVKGAPNTPTWIAVSLASCAAPTAIGAFMGLSIAGDGNSAILAPNNAYGSNASTTNHPPLVLVAPNAYQTATTLDMLLETTSVYWASDNATGAIFCGGWTDAVNAN